MEERLYDTVEAAAFLELSRETVNLLALKGKLPSQKFGRARLIREADLIAFKAIDRKPGRPPKPKDENVTGATNGQPIAAKGKPKPKQQTATKAIGQSAKRKSS